MRNLEIRMTVLVVALGSCSDSQLLDGSIASMQSFVNAVKAGILEVEPKCTNLVTTVDSSINLDSAQLLNSASSNISLETYFTVNFNVTGTDSKEWTPLPYLHYRPCSILLFDITENLQRGDNVSLNFQNWPVAPYYAGSLHTCYDFFFVNLTTSIPELEDLLLEFAKTTRKLQNVFFTLMSPDDEAFDIYARSAFAHSLVLTEKTTALNEGNTKFLKQRINFHGEPMIGTVCPICDKSIEIYQETGTWNDYLAATMYELALYANATLELSAVFGAPSTGLTETGEWDDFALPLIEGTAVLTQLLEPRPENLKFIFSAKTYLFDSVVFMTDRPKKLPPSSNLARLSKPLRSEVWIALALSVILLSVALEGVVEARRIFEFERRARRSKPRTQLFLSSVEKSLIWETIPEHKTHWTLFALLAAALDQGALDDGTGSRHLEGYMETRFLIALWYITLIVVGCGYKSDLTSMIVKPVYVHPPKTFAELAESDYKIGAIFYTEVLEDSFVAFNSTVSRKILSRVFPYDFLEPDCYVRIMKEKAACIGTRTALPRLSGKFLMDIWGRPLYLFSQETLFPLFVNMGLSMCFPSLLAPLNSFVGWLQSSGCYIIWDRWYQRVTYLEGKAAARKLYEENKLYSGEEIDDGSETKSQVILYIQVLALGYAGSLVLFLCEIFGGLYSWLKLNRFVVTNDFLRGPFKHRLD